MLYFILPNFYYYKDINNNLKQLLNEYPSYFIFDKMDFLGEEGSFPFNYLNGNNLNTVYPSFKQSFPDYYLILEENLKHDNDCLILDYSNINFRKEDLDDTHFNKTLALLENGNNQVLVSHDFVKEYINNFFPYYTIIGSEFYKGDFSKLSRVKQYYNNIDSSLNPSLVELIVSVPCQCKDYLKCKIKNQEKQFFYHQDSAFNECNKRKVISFIQQNEILNLNKKGYKYFSFDVSSFSLINLEEILEFYLLFFIKPEHRHFANLFLRGQKIYD